MKLNLFGKLIYITDTEAHSLNLNLSILKGTIPTKIHESDQVL